MKNYKPYKKNERNRKTKQGRRSNAEFPTHQDAKVPQEKGTRIGGSTTHLLSEPGTSKVQGIETFHIPPSDVGEEMTPQMAHYKSILKQLSEVNGGGSYRQDKRKLNKNIKVGEVVAVRCPDNPESYFRTVLLKKLPFSPGHQALISNAIYGDIPDGIDEVSQEQVFRRIRELNASTTTSLDAFPHTGMKDALIGADGASLVSSLHRQQQGRNGK